MVHDALNALRGLCGYEAMYVALWRWRCERDQNLNLTSIIE
jgi:hypothetical protein